MRVLSIAVAASMIAPCAFAQGRKEVPVTAVAPNPPTPMTARDRLGWVVDGNASPRSLLAGVFVSGWSTAVNTPEEWQRTWSGYGRRYVEREIDVALSNSLEAGIGALWDEDPRYTRASTGPLGARVVHAVAGGFVAHRHDRTIPAWARYTADVGSVFIENTWLPPSARDAQGTTLRLSGAFVGRSLANVWEEFWPDVRARLHH